MQRTWRHRWRKPGQDRRKHGLMFVREGLTRHGCTWALAAGAPGETRFDIWLAPAAI